VLLTLNEVLVEGNELLLSEEAKPINVLHRRVMKDIEEMVVTNARSRNNMKCKIVHVLIDSGS
jgi:hypothetical protein